MLIPAELTRSGVFEYHEADGRVVREYRPPEEVAKAESLATYDDAHVTIGHPAAGVTPQNFQSLVAGHIQAGSPKVETKADGSCKVVGRLFVGRADAMSRVDARDLVETSCGYNVRTDETPGTSPQGEPYDRVQRDIVINHVGLFRRGDSRLGTQLRLDSKGDQVRADMQADPGVGESHDPAAAAPVIQRGLRMLSGHAVSVQVVPPPKMDGRADCGCSGRTDEHLPWDECMAKAMKEYGDKEQASRVCGAIKAKYGDSMKTTIKYDGKDYVVRADHLEEDLAGIISAAEAHKVRADQAQARQDAAAAKARRDALNAKAEKAGVKAEGLTDTEVKVAIVTRSDSAFKYDAAQHSDAYLDGRVDSAIGAPLPKPAPAESAAAAGLAALAAGAGDSRQDAEDDSPIKAAERAAEFAAGLVGPKKGAK